MAEIRRRIEMETTVTLRAHVAEGACARVDAEKVARETRSQRAADVAAGGGTCGRNLDRPSRANPAARHGFSVRADAERGRHPAAQQASSESVQLGQGGAALTAKRCGVSARAGVVKKTRLVADDRFEAPSTKLRVGRGGHSRVCGDTQSGQRVPQGESSVHRKHSVARHRAITSAHARSGAGLRGELQGEARGAPRAPHGNLLRAKLLTSALGRNAVLIPPVRPSVSAFHALRATGDAGEREGGVVSSPSPASQLPPRIP